MYRAGKVYVQNDHAGTVWQDDEGYAFQYDAAYLEKKGSPVSLTLPLNDGVYRSDSMIPFFDGLIPEGWLLDITVKNWKLNPNDRMGLLLTACRDCIGAVSVISENSND
jgi:serine/threonine-protein kinase HipA